MSDILIALAFVVCVAASVIGCAMWSLHTLSARAGRTAQDCSKRDRCDISEKGKEDTENGKERLYKNLAEYERDRVIQISYALTKDGPEDSDEKRKEWERANQRVTAFHRKVCKLIMVDSQNSAYAINVLPFPDTDLMDSLVENDHKENEGTQH